jgi:hypothetical protein
MGLGLILPSAVLANDKSTADELLEFAKGQWDSFLGMIAAGLAAGAAMFRNAGRPPGDSPPPALRKGPGRFDRMDRRRAGPPRDYLRQPPAPPPPVEPPPDQPPPVQRNEYEPGGLSTKN